MKNKNNNYLLILICSLQFLSLLLLGKCLRDLSAIDQRSENRFQLIQMELISIKAERNTIQESMEGGKSDSDGKKDKRTSLKKTDVVQEYIYHYER